MHIETELPAFLSHYYEASHGPLRSLSDLEPEETERILDDIRCAGKSFASKRNAEYLSIRRELEQRVRCLFIQKGGKPQRRHPHYFIVGESPWLKSWYQDGQVLCVPLAVFSAEIVSFTYGDTFPATRFADGKPYRGQVYTLAELPMLVEAYGLPQVWNAEGHLGPERYIEAQVWADKPLIPYLDQTGE